MHTSEIHITDQTVLISAIAAWESFLTDQNRSKYTIRSFVGDIHLLADFLSPDKPIGLITNQDLDRFLDWVRSGRNKNIPCSPKSYARRITTVKSFFRWLKQHGRINLDPAESLVQRSVISPIPEILASGEISRLIENATELANGPSSDTRPLALFLLLLETGIKKSECLYLKRNHLNISNQKAPYIFIRYPASQHRNKERKIAISADCDMALNAYLSQYNPVDNIFPWSPRRLEYILEDLGKSSGLEKHLSFSMCRWTSALQDIRKGIDADTVRQKMGVSKIQWREIRLKLEQLQTQTSD